MPQGLPPIDALNVSSPTTFAQTVTPLFEPAAPLTSRLLTARPYASYSDLIDRAELILASSDLDGLTYDEKLVVANAHPAIGAPPETLSTLSHEEQGYRKTDTAVSGVGSFSLESGGEDDDAARVLVRLAALNASYEKKFGFRFVEFVNGRPKRDIVPVIERRLQNDDHLAELNIGLMEMMKIARDRLKKLENSRK